jgi:hypothetical protein
VTEEIRKKRAESSCLDLVWNVFLNVSLYHTRFVEIGVYSVDTVQGIDPIRSSSRIHKHVTQERYNVKCEASRPVLM